MFVSPNDLNIVRTRDASEILEDCVYHAYILIYGYCLVDLPIWIFVYLNVFDFVFRFASEHFSRESTGWTPALYTSGSQLCQSSGLA